MDKILNFKISEDLHKAFKLMVLHQDTTMKDILIEYIKKIVLEFKEGSPGAQAEKKELSQKVTWEKAMQHLSMTEKYMMRNCEISAGVDPRIKDRLDRYIDTFVAFSDGIEEERNM